MHLFYTIMAELINVYEDDLTKGGSYSHNSIVIPMLRYMERNFRTCTQESVADFFHISPNLCHASSQEIYWYDLYSINPAQKLQTAANLLKQTTLPVTEIAQRAGYENVTSSIRNFRRSITASRGNIGDR